MIIAIETDNDFIVTAEYSEAINFIAKSTDIEFELCIDSSGKNLEKYNIDNIINIIDAICLKLCKLITLKLKCQRINEDVLSKINECLQSNQLNKLTLYHCNINRIDDSFASVLKKNTSLTSLNLGGNLIGNIGVKGIAAAIKENENLAYLNLSRTAINCYGAYAIAELIKNNINLTSLILRNNSVGEEGGALIALAVPKSLTCLNLYNSLMSNDGALTIIEVLEKKLNSRSLNLILNCPWYGYPLKGISSLAYLFLDNTFIKDKEIIKVLKMIRKLNVIKLSLSYNYIGDAGAAFIAKELKENKNLTSLNLKNNNIGISGMQDIFAALQENQVLTNLYLDEENINEQFTYEFIKIVLLCLEVNKCLSVLEFGKNFLNYKDVIALINGDNNINKLYLSIMNFTSEQLNEILIALNLVEFCKPMMILFEQIPWEEIELEELDKIKKLETDLKITNKKNSIIQKQLKNKINIKSGDFTM